MDFDVDGHVEANGLRFAYRSQGDGPLVLCLHGFPDSPGTFRFLAGALADAGFRAVAPWMRGYGPTAGGSPSGLPELGRDAVALGEALAPGERFFVVGEDWGAGAAAVAGVLAPERIAGLVTLAMPHPAHFLAGLMTDLGQLRRSWYIWFFQRPGLPESLLTANDFALVDRLWAEWAPGYERGDDHRAEINAGLSVDPSAVIGYYRSVFAESAGADPDAGAVFGPIGVPTLSLMGAGDGCIGAHLLAGQEAYWSAPVRNEVLEGCGHFPHLERPEAVAERIVGFLQHAGLTDEDMRAAARSWTGPGVDPTRERR